MEVSECRPGDQVLIRTDGEDVAGIVAAIGSEYIFLVRAIGQKWTEAPQLTAQAIIRRRVIKSVDRLREVIHPISLN